MIDSLMIESKLRIFGMIFEFERWTLTILHNNDQGRKKNVWDRHTRTELATCKWQTIETNNVKYYSKRDDNSEKKNLKKKKRFISLNQLKFLVHYFLASFLGNYLCV